ncbi:MAG: hypothetical protein ACE5RG_06480, partial [Candidatus Nitrosomaritimum yanchengensis]
PPPIIAIHAPICCILDITKQHPYTLLNLYYFVVMIVKDHALFLYALQDQLHYLQNPLHKKDIQIHIDSTQVMFA